MKRGFGRLKTVGIVVGALLLFYNIFVDFGDWVTFFETLYSLCTLHQNAILSDRLMSLARPIPLAVRKMSFCQLPLQDFKVLDSP